MIWGLLAVISGHLGLEIMEREWRVNWVYFRINTRVEQMVYLSASTWVLKGLIVPCFTLMWLHGTTTEYQDTQNVVVLQSSPSFCQASCPSRCAMHTVRFMGYCKDAQICAPIPHSCLRVKKGTDIILLGFPLGNRSIQMILTGGRLQGHTSTSRDLQEQ